jgi:hypothetical protein
MSTLLVSDYRQKLISGTAAQSAWHGIGEKDAGLIPNNTSQKEFGVIKVDSIKLRPRETYAKPTGLSIFLSSFCKLRGR